MTFLLNRAFFLLIFASCISGSAIAVELERRALVIANAEYSELSRLPASKHDGVGFTALLRDKGYDVTFDEAGDSGEAEKLHASWTGFIKQVGNFEKSGIAVVYFSGHGVEIDNDSYLLPIDLSANASEAEVRLKGLSVRKMYREFKEHQTRLKDEKGITLHGLFIFDACRTAFAEKRKPVFRGA